MLSSGICREQSSIAPSPAVLQTGKCPIKARRVCFPFAGSTETKDVHGLHCIGGLQQLETIVILGTEIRSDISSHALHH